MSQVETELGEEGGLPDGVAAADPQHGDQDPRPDPELQAPDDYPPWLRPDQRIRWDYASQLAAKLLDETEIPLGPGEPPATAADHFAMARAIFASDVPTGEPLSPETEEELMTSGGTSDGTEQTPDSAQTGMVEPAAGGQEGDIVLSAEGLAGAGASSSTEG